MTFEHTPPPNWVVERAKCRIELTFEALVQIVERDVSEMNDLPMSRRRGYRFEVEINGEGLRPLLRVRRCLDSDTDRGDERTVTFECFDDWIGIKASGKNPRRASLKWHNASASCRLFVDLKELKDRPFEVWELSQEYLGPIFFD